MSLIKCPECEIELREPWEPCQTCRILRESKNESQHGRFHHFFEFCFWFFRGISRDFGCFVQKKPGVGNSPGKKAAKKKATQCGLSRGSL